MAAIGVPRNFAVGIIWKVQHIFNIYSILHGYDSQQSSKIKTQNCTHSMFKLTK